MDKNQTTWITIGIIAVVVLIGAYFIGAGGLTGNAVRVSDGEIIKIGFISPLTGPATIYGLEDQNALALAVEEINNKGGIDGRSIKIIYEDGKCNGKDAANAAQKLINVDGVKIIMGGGCSGETLSIAPITESNKVILFSSLSTSPDITNAGDFVFRNAPSDSDSASVTAELAWNNGVRKIAIISQNTDYAQAFKLVFIKRFEELSGEVVSDENYNTEQTDFKTIITKTLAANPDAILIDPQETSGGLVAKQLKELGYNGPLYGNVIFAGEELLEKYGDSIEGIYFSDASGLDPESNDKANSFLESYEAKYDKKPDFDYYAGARYDSMYLLAEAIEAVGYDSEKIRDYLYDLDNFDGVLGSFSFDENGDVAGITFEDRQVVNNKVEVL